MKFLLPLLSFFLGNAKSLFKEPSVAFTQQVVLHVRAMTTVLVSTIASLALSCVGISLLISSVAGQLDKNEDFHFTGGMFLYLALTIISAGVLVYSLRQKTWLKAMNLEEKPKESHKGGALENAIAILVLDFVEERQNRRTDKKHEQAE